ncbi:VanZ like family protein [Filibacter tadaridae]|uniref:VanZ like family protein n=2 Tax=Filibacter tadaridae TaxID=2483811 RepID=A0A3P5WQC8_9BACL|nr:VanZ like family protein [Filibacter tadaridae]
MFKNVWRTFFTIYILMILNFVIIKFDGNINRTITNIKLNIERRNQGEFGYNLIPFNTIKTYITELHFSIATLNILGNIIPFIPMGFLIPMAFPSQRNIYKTMLTCFIIIFIIETLQLIFFLGIFDIDDFILNLISCFIGFIIYTIYQIIFKVIIQKIRS